MTNPEINLNVIMSKREMTDSLERPGFFKEVKVVLVGPAKCGKTALIQRFVNDIYSDNYVPTGFEKYSMKRKIGDYTIVYSIWDTSGSGAYDTVRPLAYQDANVFILCFNIAEPKTLDLAVTKWLPEIRSHSSTLIPIILCGCKADKRNNNHVVDTTLLYMNQTDDITRYEKAYVTCQHIGAIGYTEISSKYSNKAINEVFEIAAEAALGITSFAHNNQLSKNVMKKRKIHSISSSTSSSANSSSSSSSKTKSKSQSMESSTISSSAALQQANNCRITSQMKGKNFTSNNGKPQIKSEIRKSTKNCTIM